MFDALLTWFRTSRASIQVVILQTDTKPLAATISGVDGRCCAHDFIFASRQFRRRDSPHRAPCTSLLRHLRTHGDQDAVAEPMGECRSAPRAAPMTPGATASAPGVRCRATATRALAKISRAFVLRLVHHRLYHRRCSYPATAHGGREKLVSAVSRLSPREAAPARAFAVAAVLPRGTLCRRLCNRGHVDHP